MARQPVRPVLVASMERLFDQQAPKAGAIDEQFARHFAAILQPEGLGMTIEPFSRLATIRPSMRTTPRRSATSRRNAA